MVVCVWRLVIPEAKTSIFVQDCKQEVLPKHRSAAGLLHVALWHRVCIGYAEIQIVSTWRSSSALQSFSGDEFLQAIKTKHGYLIIPEQSFSCYDIIS